MNRTLIDDVLLMNSTPSSSADPFPAPADPFPDDYVNITEFAEIDPTLFGNVTNGESAENDFFDFLDFNSWVFYVIFLVGVLIIFTFISAIGIWLCKHKKRMINQSNDPMLSSNYGQEIKWSRFCCCGKRGAAAEASSGNILDHRQNSASNLEAYGRRDPLPSMIYKNPVAPMNKEKENHNSEVIDDKNLAIYINGIKNVPSAFIPESQYRKLPPLRLPKTDIYQNLS